MVWARNSGILNSNLKVFDLAISYTALTQTKQELFQSFQVYFEVTLTFHEGQFNKATELHGQMPTCPDVQIILSDHHTEVPI